MFSGRGFVFGKKDGMLFAKKKEMKGLFLVHAAWGGLLGCAQM